MAAGNSHWEKKTHLLLESEARRKENRNEQKGIEEKEGKSKRENLVECCQGNNGK